MAGMAGWSWLVPDVCRCCSVKTRVAVPVLVELVAVMVVFTVPPAAGVPLMMLVSELTLRLAGSLDAP